jgi:dTDP-glucose 4,6-dehydratase
MDFSQTTARLAWRPERRIGQGLAETVAWYLENEEWWRAVKSGEYRDYYQRQYGQG